MMKENKKILIIGIVFVMLVALVVIGLTYAFFIAEVEGNTNATPTVVETGDLKLLFNDTEIIAMENALPGESKTKTFTVQNIGNSKVFYDIDIIDVINTFVNGDLVYTLTSTNGGGNITNATFPSNNNTLLSDIEINPGVTHVYTMTILFKETGENQDINQGSVFNGKLQINATKLLSDEVVFGIEETVGTLSINQSKSVSVIGAYYGSVSCESADTTIAECAAKKDRIDIYGKRSGTTQISVKESSKNLQVNYTVTIKDVILTLSEITGKVSKNNFITVDIIGQDYGALTCETSDASKATCLINGTELIINGVDVGSATITVRENLMNKTANFEVIIREATVYEQILADNEAHNDSEINFSTSTGDGLYYTADNQYGEDGERIYYFRGSSNNNWISFANKLWRIVRTNSEEGVKLIYSGDGNTTSSGLINSNTKFHGGYNNEYYAGYTYNTSGFSGVQTNSTIKGVVDNWYNNNLSSYSNYLSTTAIYCANRGGGNANNNYIYYPAYYRNNSNRPNYSCPTTNENRYTVNKDTGNGFLQNPIALLTADEALYAGARGTSTYLYDNASTIGWWTMTPAYYTPAPAVLNYTVNTSGNVYPVRLDTSAGVRPVISLKPCVVVTGGNGTKETPYTISDLSC